MWLILVVALLLALTNWPQAEGFKIKHNFEFDLGSNLDVFAPAAKNMETTTAMSADAVISAMPFKENIRQWYRNFRN